ncbi:MAG: bifunctional oligoribonuclease/PAP phosphatase NrnA [Oscillospiraceae bacterium]|jgi:phosphoesterase RecJ-like protein|nr:bifunctional oligoribonuclease/PAP phosphatase NrnA [Oscillospiraceae bacterium]
METRKAAITIEDAAAFLSTRDNYLIITHRQPDGDTLGCAVALCAALRTLGKSAAVLTNPQITRSYAELTAPYELDTSDFGGYTLIAVDVPAASHIQVNFPSDEVGIAMLIDHHGGHEGFAERNLILPRLASCGEVTLRVLRALDAEITPAIATALYIAVSTDTGCFRYKNTTAETLYAAAELVSLGAENGRINYELFTVKRLSRIKLEAAVISGMEFYDRGDTAVASITLEMIKAADADEGDMEDTANIALTPQGVETAITLREMPDGTTKLSVRTANKPNAAEICRMFGGGGHDMAAGATIKAALPEAKSLVIAAISAA